MHKHFKDIKINKLPDSEAEVSGELTLEYIQECRPEALKNLNNSISLPGFRSGHIPEDVLIKKVGEMGILEETAEIALGRAYPQIIEETKLSPISRPHISITKLAPGVPLEFKIKVALEPDFQLPDYKKLIKALEHDAPEDVTDKEINDLMEEIKKRDIKVELKENETLEGKVKENLGEEKKFRAAEKKRLKIVDELVKHTEVNVPKVLMESEVNKMLAQFKDDVTRMGMKWEDYLKEAKKTEAEIKEEWKPKALERVKAEMIIAKIAEAEKIEPTQEEIEHEASHMMHHYPDADPLRVRLYVFNMIRNQKVIEFLEKI